MPKLTDTQLVILSVAARRKNGAVLPLSKSLKINSAAGTKILDGLLKKGLLKERPAVADEPHWREARAGRRRALVITEGGLSKAALKRLDHLADPRGNDGRPPRPAPPRLRPGTRLVREWRGSVHHVTVGDDGFDYRGARYASLSRIAREITGTRWSGPLFFGLRKAGGRAEVSADEH